jgi:hypothetical protein
MVSHPSPHPQYRERVGIFKKLLHDILLYLYITTGYFIAGLSPQTCPGVTLLPGYN